jgi:anti-sigma regulatory factor (Ser/Thr protein kinase)
MSSSAAIKALRDPGESRPRSRPAPLDSIRSYIANHNPGTGGLLRGDFEIWTLSHAEKLSTMLAMQYPDPDSAAIGIWELLSNAIEHGNLEIDYDLKTTLLRNGQLQEEIERRLADPIYGARVALVQFRRLRRSLKLKVTDQGPGFDHARFTNSAPSTDRPNGRGIFIAAHMSFNRLHYQGRGNVVEATSLIPPLPVGEG